MDSWSRRTYTKTDAKPSLKCEQCSKAIKDGSDYYNGTFVEENYYSPENTYCIDCLRDSLKNQIKHLEDFLNDIGEYYG